VRKEAAADAKDLGRNDPCHCGSGKKYKHCHLAKDEEAVRKARAKATEAAPAVEDEEKKDTGAPPPKKSFQPWQGRANTRGFQKRAFQRKSG
jgi:hypothetical protein